MAKKSLYGMDWVEGYSSLAIEMECIRQGGLKEGLPFHYERMRNLLWPELDDHRWHRLCRDNILSHKVTVLLGAGSSGKTHEASWLYLCEYFCYPDETLVMVSSTDMRGLQLRVFGEIKMLFDRAKDAYPELPGHILESKCAICTDAVEEDRVRDMRKGVIGIPTVQNGKMVGLGKWVGVKQKRIRLIADECQAMASSFLSAFANLDKNVDFRAVCIGNPNDPLDPLGKAAEPIDGWSGHLEPSKTSTWKTRFMNGVCVNLIGTDSPNFDFPADQPTRYKYLISREKIANTLSFFPKDSVEYMSQCVGAMKVGVLSRRVVTRDLCAQFGAREEVLWDGSGPFTKVFGLDAAYGGDRCIGGHVEFGPAFVTVKGQRERKIVINVHQPVIVPTRLDPGRQPEDNIADWIKDYCSRNDIAARNVFHDSTGRGGLGTAIARVFSADCNPVEFGGSPSKRPVSQDLMIWDHEEHQRRPMRCDEHYSKFVTELWYTIRYVIEGTQMRGLPEDVMDEMCMREWDKTRNNKIEVETKRDMKERIGRSPDLGDWLAICVEGCRRLGFQLTKLGNDDVGATDTGWILDLNRRAEKLRDRRNLVFSR